MGVGETGVGETGVGEMGVGETGVGEMGIPRSVMSFRYSEAGTITLFIFASQKLGREPPNTFI